MVVEFFLSGTPFVALNGGAEPGFKFSEAISFKIDCRDQAEVDYFWAGLLVGGGTPGPCGWLKDRFGVSWQVVPLPLQEMLAAGGEGGKRVMVAMMAMGKLDVAKLREAYEGEKKEEGRVGE